jgi:Arc/MetJ-type ribon-helix-helix transcriptional regulator
MPIAKRKPIARKNVRIPQPIISEVDRIVRENGVYVNRQQFIETALRERIGNIKSAEKTDAAFVDRVRHRLLVHVLVNVAKARVVPPDHLDMRRCERYIRQCVEERAEREGKMLTKERRNEFIADLSEYCKELIEGVSVEANRKCA